MSNALVAMLKSMGFDPEQLMDNMKKMGMMITELYDSQKRTEEMVKKIHDVYYRDEVRPRIQTSNGPGDRGTMEG